MSDVRVVESDKGKGAERTRDEHIDDLTKFREKLSQVFNGDGITDATNKYFTGRRRSNCLLQ